MLRKLAIISAMLVLLTIVAVPLALAQLDTSEGEPRYIEPESRYTVGCSELYGRGEGALPAICAVDENGLIPTPDGTKAPYTVTGNPVVLDQLTGNYVELVDGEWVVVGRPPPPGPPVPEVPDDRAGLLQYDNAS